MNFSFLILAWAVIAAPLDDKCTHSADRLLPFQGALVNVDQNSDEGKQITKDLKFAIKEFMRDVDKYCPDDIKDKVHAPLKPTNSTESADFIVLAILPVLIPACAGVAGTICHFLGIAGQ